MIKRGPLSYVTPRGRSFGPNSGARAKIYDTIEQCLEEGSKAYMAGLQREENPYPSSSTNAAAWDQGYELLREKTERMGPQVF